MPKPAGAPRRNVEPDDEPLWRLWAAFGQHLRGLRARLGVDVRTLASQAGVGYATVTTLERGGRTQDARSYLPNPKDDVLGRLARAYGVPLEDLTGFEHDGLRIGWYAERPQTTASRRGEALPGARDRGQDEIQQRLDRMEERLDHIAHLLGGNLDEEPPKRRRGRAS